MQYGHVHREVSGTVTKIYKVVGMHCPACATSIELDLEDVGIQASCSYAKQTLEVKSEVEEIKLKEIVKPLGYDLE